MRNLFSILIFCSITISCHKNEITTKFEDLIGAKAIKNSKTFDTLENSKDLLSNIESKYNINLCDSTFRQIQKVPITKGKNVEISFSIFKHCFPYMSLLSKTEVYLKTDDKIRIDMNYSSIDSTEFYIYKLIENRLDKEEIISIQLEFTWEKTNKKSIDSMFIYTYQAVQKFANKKSIDWYGAKLEELSIKDFKTFKSRFYVFSAITNVRPDFPKQ